VRRNIAARLIALRKKRAGRQHGQREKRTSHA
jgi:hypothetical protein